LEEGKNLIFETVLSAPDKVEFIQRAKQKGYFTRLFFIGTDNPQINASRVTQRVLGWNCAYLAPLVDRLYIYDNPVDNVFAELLFRASEGQLTKQYTQIHDWANIIFEKINQFVFKSRY
jgi:predicted ABC-type ATPase